VTCVLEKANSLFTRTLHLFSCRRCRHSPHHCIAAALTVDWCGLPQVLQMRPHADGAGARAFEYYVHKTYYKTGSLMANSCRAAALLGGAPVDVQDSAHE
jgi:geranylgeranyl pyrophosphate synthase